VTNETMAPEDQELQEPTPAHRRIQRPTRTTTPLERPGPIEIPSPPTLGAEISPTPFQFLLPVVGALTSVVMMVVMRNGQPLFMLIAAVVFTVALVSGLGFAISSRGRATKQLRLHRRMELEPLCIPRMHVGDVQIEELIRLVERLDLHDRAVDALC